MERESEGTQAFFQVFLVTLANARATIQQVVLECAEQSKAANVVSNGLLVKDDRHRQTAAIVIDANGDRDHGAAKLGRSEEHTSELQSLMRISYAVFCLKKKKQNKTLKYVSTTLNNKTKH